MAQMMIVASCCWCFQKSGFASAHHKCDRPHFGEPPSKGIPIWKPARIEESLEVNSTTCSQIISRCL